MTTQTKRYSLVADTNINIVDRESTPAIAFDLTNRETGARIHISEGAGASTHYMSMLATRVANTVNSVEFKMAMAEDTYCRFHREGDAPTAIIVPSLASRSVTVNMADPYINNIMPVKATAYAGTSIVSKPATKAVMISMIHEKYDSECDGHITELTLQQEMGQVLRQLDNEITTTLIKTIEKEDEQGQKYFTNLKQPKLPSGTMMEVYDAIEAGIYGATRIMKQFGGQIEDFVIGVTPAVYAIMERASRRMGHNTVECFVGTDVYQYNMLKESGESELFIFPKTLVAMSFREQVNGTIIQPIVTRKAEKQSTTIELVGTVDLICDGYTKVDANGQSQSIKLPLITKVTFDTV